MKTSILYFVKSKVKDDDSFIKNNLNDLCASIQNSIISILIDKLKKAIKITGIKEIAIAGGVSANSELRKSIKEFENFGCKTYIAPFEYCTDNAGMIGITGYYKYLNNKFTCQKISASSRMKVDQY